MDARIRLPTWKMLEIVEVYGGRPHSENCESETKRKSVVSFFISSSTCSHVFFSYNLVIISFSKINKNAKRPKNLQESSTSWTYNGWVEIIYRILYIFLTTKTGSACKAIEIDWDALKSWDAEQAEPVLIFKKIYEISKFYSVLFGFVFIIVLSRFGEPYRTT